MKIYGTSDAGGRIIGFLMIPWLLVLVPMCHDLALSEIGTWLSVPFVVGIAYAGRAVRTHLAKR
jgi:hypothetical protein